MPLIAERSLATLFSPAVAVTLFGVGMQGAAALLQIFVARKFGAGDELDAYFAAYTLPQYFLAVVVSVVPAIYIPAVTAHSEDPRSLRRATAGALLAFCALSTLCALVGMILSSPLLHLTTPGLTSRSHDLAVTVAWIVWPGVVALVLTSVLTGALNVQRAFAWPAIAGFVAGTITLAVAIGLAGRIGVFGVAAAATLGAFVQVALLLPFLFRGAAGTWRGAWKHPAVAEMFRHFWPLAVSGLLVRCTIVVERFLASRFVEGTIAQVTFASRLLALVSYVLSIGISTVMFPEVAQQVASGSIREMSARLSRATRSMYVLVAPVMCCGIVLAAPAVAALLEGGRFGPSDTATVAALLRIYLLSLPATCVGMLTSRTLYSLKLAKVVALLSGIEAALYIVYTFLLANFAGIYGVAWGFVIYCAISISWQVLIIARRTGWTDAGGTGVALLRVSLCAVLAAGTAAAVCVALRSPWSQLIFGTASGGSVFLLSLAVIAHEDFASLVQAPRQILRSRR